MSQRTWRWIDRPVTSSRDERRPANDTNSRAIYVSAAAMVARAGALSLAIICAARLLQCFARHPPDDLLSQLISERLTYGPGSGSSNSFGPYSYIRNPSGARYRHASHLPSLEPATNGSNKTTRHHFLTGDWSLESVIRIIYLCILLHKHRDICHCSLISVLSTTSLTE